MNMWAGGWQASALFQALSGGPLNVTIGRDQALTGAQNQRPNVSGDWTVSNPTNDRYFDTSVVLARRRPEPMAILDVTH